MRPTGFRRKRHVADLCWGGWVPVEGLERRVALAGGSDTKAQHHPASVERHPGSTREGVMTSSRARMDGWGGLGWWMVDPVRTCQLGGSVQPSIGLTCCSRVISGPQPDGRAPKQGCIEVLA
jgi:hypothetical protein